MATARSFNTTKYIFRFYTSFFNTNILCYQYATLQNTDLASSYIHYKCPPQTHHQKCTQPTTHQAYFAHARTCKPTTSAFRTQTMPCVLTILSLYLNIVTNQFATTRTTEMHSYRANSLNSFVPVYLRSASHFSTPSLFALATRMLILHIREPSSAPVPLQIRA